MRLGTVSCKGEIVVLEVETDTWKIDERLDAGLAQFLWVACDDIASANSCNDGRQVLPMPERWRINGELSVPPLTMTNFFAL
jgi:hypothetical protein